MISRTNNTSGGDGRGLAYFLIGGGIGAAVALLFAPKSGSELRHDIADVTKKGYDGTIDIARRVKEESSDLYHSLLDRSHDLFETASDTASAIKDKANGALQKVTDEVSKAESKHANGGRRASQIM